MTVVDSKRRVQILLLKVLVYVHSIPIDESSQPIRWQYSQIDSQPVGEAEVAMEVASHFYSLFCLNNGSEFTTGCFKCKTYL